MEIVGIVLVVVAAIFINGIIAEIEDSSPGGFNNPDGKWSYVIKHPKRIPLACAGSVMFLSYEAQREILA